MKIVLLFTCFFLTNIFSAQISAEIIGTFQLEKISFKNKSISAKSNIADFSKLVKTAFFSDYKGTLGEYEESELQQQASEFVLTYFNSRIEFRQNGALNNHSQKKNLPTSGEYLVGKNKLYLDWETGERAQFKILKIKNNELVLKNISSKIIFHYSKISKRDFDEMNERLKMEKNAEWPKPDKVRIEAEKKAQEEFKNKK